MKLKQKKIRKGLKKSIKRMMIKLDKKTNEIKCLGIKSKKNFKKH